MSGSRNKSVNEKRDSATAPKDKPATASKGTGKADGKKQRPAKEEKKAAKEGKDAKEKKEKKGNARGESAVRSAKGKDVGASVEVGEVSKLRKSKDDVN